MAAVSFDDWLAGIDNEEHPDLGEAGEEQWTWKADTATVFVVMHRHAARLLLASRTVVRINGQEPSGTLRELVSEPELLKSACERCLSRSNRTQTHAIVLERSGRALDMVALYRKWHPDSTGRVELENQLALLPSVWGSGVPMAPSPSGNSTSPASGAAENGPDDRFEADGDCSTDDSEGGFGLTSEQVERSFQPVQTLLIRLPTSKEELLSPFLIVQMSWGKVPADYDLASGILEAVRLDPSRDAIAADPLVKAVLARKRVLPRTFCDWVFLTNETLDEATRRDCDESVKRLAGISEQPSTEVWLPNDLYWSLCQLFDKTIVQMPFLWRGNVGRFFAKLAGDAPAWEAGSSGDTAARTSHPAQSGAGGGAATWSPPSVEELLAQSRRARDAASAASAAGAAAPVQETRPSDSAAGHSVYVNQRAIATLDRDFLFKLTRVPVGDEVGSYGCLFYGPPGSGKTTIASGLLNHAGFKVGFRGCAADLNRKYFGETEQKLRETLSGCQTCAGVPYVVFFDEIDSIAQRRDMGHSIDSKLDIMASLLSQLGSETHSNLFVIGTTNRKDAIDPAVIRTGRISTTLYIGRLMSQDRLDLLEKQWRISGLDRAVLTSEYDGIPFLTVVQRETQNCTGALLRGAVANVAAELDRLDTLGHGVSSHREVAELLLRTIRLLASRSNDPDLVMRTGGHDIIHEWSPAREEALSRVLGGPESNGQVVMDLSNGMLLQLDVRRRGGLVDHMELPLIRSAASSVQPIAWAILQTMMPESLFVIDTARLEKTGQAGVMNPVKALSMLMEEARALAESGTVAVVLDIDNLVIPVVDVQTQVAQASGAETAAVQSSKFQSVSVLRREVLAEIMAVMRRDPFIMASEGRFLAVAAVTRAEFLAEQLREGLGFYMEGQEWDASKHGPHMSVLRDQVQSTHTDNKWEVARSKYTLRGVQDAYMLQVFWNPGVGDKNTLMVGVLPDDEDPSHGEELGTKPASVAYQLGTRTIVSTPMGGATTRMQVPSSPSTTVNPGDTIGIMVVADRVVLLKQRGSLIEHAMDLFRGLPAGRGWHVAVAMRGVKDSGASVKLVKTRVDSQLRECLRTPVHAMLHPGGDRLYLSHKNTVCGVVLGKGDEWVTMGLDGRMVSGAGDGHKYYFEAVMKVCASGYVKLGVHPWSGALTLGERGRSVGETTGSGWGYYVYNHTRRWDGDSPAVEGGRPRLVEPWAGKVVCMLVDLDSTSPAFCTISFGVRQTVGGVVEWMGPLFDDALRAGTEYQAVMSLFEAGDVVEVRGRPDIPLETP
jgi:hypothetical protein